MAPKAIVRLTFQASIYAAATLRGTLSAGTTAISLFDLSQESAAIIGQGNVALDVARMLAKPVDELRHTDVSATALEMLVESRVRDIHVFGRRGPMDTKFSPRELAEFCRHFPAAIPSSRWTIYRLFPQTVMVILSGSSICFSNLRCGGIAPAAAGAIFISIMSRLPGWDRSK